MRNGATHLTRVFEVVMEQQVHLEQFLQAAVVAAVVTAVQMEPREAPAVVVLAVVHMVR
jgi:hypothetical protein